MITEWSLQTVYNDVENFCRIQHSKESARRRRSSLWKIISVFLLLLVVGFAGQLLTSFRGW